MMKSVRVIAALLVVGLVATAFTTADKTAVKCLIQLTNYSGEGAYVVVSLIDENKEYVETLYVQGRDDEWYSEIPAWWKFYGKYRPNIDAISGATVGGGERSIAVLNIPTDKIDKGYSLRFETAVEDKGYHKDDVSIALTRENLNSKKEGTGFIRYVRMLAQ